MPELPEVETVRRGLEPALAGARLMEVRINRPDIRFPFPERFAARLEGARVERLERRAKYLLFPLDTGETWVSHLGMTGRFTVEGWAPGEFEEAAPTGGKHEHFSCCTDGGHR
ncbi:MAG: DNA-formamidopyrimidine glycosylase family protein, partial [Caulobacteraceae bacterium]